MSRLWQARCRLATVFAVGQIAVFQLAAETVTNVPAPQKLFSTPTNLLLPPMARSTSPVDLFRRLLALTPAERENSLTNRPPEIRDRILAKVLEYEDLDPNERELRLRATELRWYLLPLLHESPTNRAAWLAQVPDDLRDLVKSRLDIWTILPPPLQQEFLDNERALRYFTHVDLPNNPTIPPIPPGRGRHHGQQDHDLIRWNALPEDQRQKITAQFNQFFELTPEEKQETLNTLSDAEREQMKKTLQAFDNLSAEQRAVCIRSFAKFASMNAVEKQEFLKNAERWSQMSPEERQAWRDLVVNVPLWPPLPPGLMPPPLPPDVQSAMATNKN
jgi:hypothetical protein